MKRSQKVIVLLTIIFGLFCCYRKVTADSGWDSSYDSGSFDSGSSWDSGSDFESGFGGYYYHSGRGGSTSDALIIATIVIIIVIIIIYSKNGKGSGGSGNFTRTNNYIDISQEEIDKFDSSINREEFKERAFNIYKDIQLAWMNFDKDKIRLFTTDEIYNMYSAQLDALKIKNQRNIMANIEYKNAKIISIKEEAGILTIEVYLNVECYDYVVKEGTGEAIRGDKNHKMNIEYILTFVKSVNNNSDKVICPNCGAEVEMTASSKCKYCDSVLVRDASDIVMSKKQNIGQRMVR